MTIISNTTVVSNFAAIWQLDLLHRLYGSLYISIQVYEEIRAGIAEGYHFYTGIESIVSPLSKGGWIQLASLMGVEEFRLFAEMPEQLHSGESSCLAIAQHRKWLFLSDDRMARREAQRRNVPFSGTIGVLVLSVERRLCSLEDANLWLNQMMASGYHSPVTDLTPLVLKP